MTAALNAIIPFFAIVLIGWFAAKRGVFDTAGLAGLNAFIFSVALPPLLFRTMARAPEADAAALSLVAHYAAITLLLYVVARLFGRIAHGLTGAENAIYGHLAVNGNAGFLGLPLITAALGAGATLPVALALTTDIVLIMSLTTLSLEASRAFAGGGLGVLGALAAAGRAVWRAATNPVLLGAVGGVFWGAIGVQRYGLELPTVVAAIMDTLGQAAAPAALFAVGATLGHNRLDQRVGEIGTLSIWKLVAHPAATLLTFVLLAPDTPALWIAAVVLSASLPASNNAVVFANVYRAYEARASATVLVTTALSVLTFTALAVWLAQRFGLDAIGG